eukprot:scpid103024/ scgid34290/ 
MLVLMSYCGLAVHMLCAFVIGSWCHPVSAGYPTLYEEHVSSLLPRQDIEYLHCKHWDFCALTLCTVRALKPLWCTMAACFQFHTPKRQLTGLLHLLKKKQLFSLLLRERERE